MGQALLTLDHYCYFYYQNSIKQSSTGRDTSVIQDCLPDILYSQIDEGEILIEWNKKSQQLDMITFVEISDIY